VVTEVGSALNGQSRKFLALLWDRSVDTILVEHRDRCCRLGAECVEAAREAEGLRLVVVDPSERDDDLVRDATELLTSLSRATLGRTLAVGVDLSSEGEPWLAELGPSSRTRSFPPGPKRPKAPAPPLGFRACRSRCAPLPWGTPMISGASMSRPGSPPIGASCRMRSSRALRSRNGGPGGGSGSAGASRRRCASRCATVRWSASASLRPQAATLTPMRGLPRSSR